MGVAFFLRDYTEQELDWWVIFISVHLIFIFYFTYIHGLIFRNREYNGAMAVGLTLIGPGIGQAYNRQPIKSLIYFGLFVGFIVMLRDNPGNDGEISTYLVWTFVGLYILFIADAVRGTQKAERKSIVKSRTKEVHKKAKVLLEYKDSGHEFGVDTNILMHEPDLLVHLLEKSGMDLYMSMMVFNELDGLKKSDNVVTRTQAQTAFDIIEEFQRRNKLHMLKTPRTDDIRKYGLGGSPDEKIIGTYLRERERKHPNLMFISNDKGARILARNVGMPIVEF